MSRPEMQKMMDELDRKLPYNRAQWAASDIEHAIEQLDCLYKDLNSVKYADLDEIGFQTSKLHVQYMLKTLRKLENNASELKTYLNFDKSSEKEN